MVTQHYVYPKDEDNYYLVMEQEGESLLDFVMRAHQHIKSGYLSKKEWRRGGVEM